MMLTDIERAALSDLCHGLRHFGSLVTGRNVRKRTVLALERKGLAESAGCVVLCDADGFTVEPERYREGWRPTLAGLELAIELGEVTHDVEKLRSKLAAERGKR